MLRMGHVKNFILISVFLILFSPCGSLAADPGWTPKPGSLTMDVNGRVYVDGHRVETPGYVIAAFGPGGEDDCRGRGNINQLFGDWGFYFPVSSEVDGETINFKVWDSDADRVYSLEDTLTFEAGQFVSKDLDVALTLEKVYPTRGEMGKELKVELKGAGFDGGTRVSMYVDAGNKKAIIGTVDTPGPALAVTVVGNLAYVADGDDGLQVVDISNSENPVIIGAVDTPGVAQDIAVVEDLAYVADDDSLQIVDISDPADPSIVGAIETLCSSAFGVTAAGYLAYVAVGSCGLQIVDVSDPDNPVALGAIDTPGWALGVAAVGDLLCVADYDFGIQIIDISAPETPVIVSTIDTPGSALAVTVVGNLAYVAAGGDGLQIIDVSASEAPLVVGAVDTPGLAYYISVAGDLAHVADGYGKLQIVDASNPKSPVVIRYRQYAGLCCWGCGGLGPGICGG